MHILGKDERGAQVSLVAPLKVPVVQQIERKVADLEVAGAIPAGNKYRVVQLTKMHQGSWLNRLKRRLVKP